MQKFKFHLTVLFFLCCLQFLFAQTDCGNNGNFELGNTNGWVCKWGSYGVGVYSSYCNVTGPGICPTFPDTFPNVSCLNTNGMNASLTSGVDRHTIMTSNYRPWAGAGMGMDSISNNTVPVVPPGGGNFSFRLGDAIAGGIGVNPNRLARAEAMRFSFLVSPANAGFTYRYAVFLQDPGHLPEEQPRFEVFVTQPDSNDRIIPCGYYKFVAGSSNPYCSGTRDSSTFKYGTSGWRYTDWTDVGLDLSGYIGQNIAVEFRTADCFPASNVTYTQNSVVTTCTNTHIGNEYYGICCWGSAPQTCTTVSSSCESALFHAPGTHSAYAYIEAFCSPIVFVPNPVCLGGDSVQICAPPGYQNWMWPNGSTTECIYIQNPIPGDTFVVHMKSQAGCPTKSTIKLTGPDILTTDTAICEGTSGTIPLTGIVTIPGDYLYSWTGPGVSSTQLTTIIPLPTSTSTYTISVTDTTIGCVFKKTMTITVVPIEICIVDISEKEKNDFFKVYPNPSSGKVTFIFGESLQNATIKIYDLLGREIYFEEFKGDRILINRKLKSGIYYAELRTGGQQLTRKIMISE